MSQPPDLPPDQPPDQPPAATPHEPPAQVVLLLDPDRFDETVLALQDAGVVIDQQNPTIGTVSGRVAEDALAALAALDGVIAVERERSVSLPDPESDLQ